MKRPKSFFVEERLVGVRLKCYPTKFQNSDPHLFTYGSGFLELGIPLLEESLECPVNKLFFGDLKTIQLLMASDLFNLCKEGSRWPKLLLKRSLLAAGKFP